MYVLVQYIGLIAGASTSGSILQLAWLSTSKVMAAGSFLGMIGVILVFPGERIRFLHSSVPQFAYLGVFIQGYGCQLIGVASLSAVEEIHTLVGRRNYTRENSSTATTLWLCAWMIAVYMGHLLALFVMKYMSYSQGGWVLAGFCALSFVMSIAQDTAIRRSAAASVVKSDSPQQHVTLHNRHSSCLAVENY